MTMYEEGEYVREPNKKEDLAPVGWRTESLLITAERLKVQASALLSQSQQILARQHR